MAAENVPQMRQDFGLLGQLEQNPHVDQRKLLLRRLHLFGIKDPESWLQQEEQPIPPLAMEILKKIPGIDPRLVDFAVAQAQRQQPLLNAEGPDAGQVGQMMHPTDDQQPEGAAA
jgi:hypothetical protein